MKLMSDSTPSLSRLSTLNEELDMILATLPKLTNEEHRQCYEMAKIMLKVAVPLDTILNTVHAKDQIYGEVSMSFAVRVDNTKIIMVKDVAECRLMFNHWRKTLKNGTGWKHLCETLSLTASMEIVFEFIDPTVNHVLFWSCL
ncbi:hypothetical protein HKD37_07G019035 [Glycine soja]